MEGVLYKGDLFLLLRYHRGGFRIVFKRAKILFESIADVHTSPKREKMKIMYLKDATQVERLERQI